MGRLTLLGTGDPLNHERAQTSLALDLADDDILLIDVSSGTILLRQLLAAGIALGRVRHVAITHRHFDHAGGLAPLLVALSGQPGGPVTIHALPDTLAALRAQLALSIPGVEDWLGPRLSWRDLAFGEPVALADATLLPFAVEHGIECAGVRIAQGGRSFAFSADTRPVPGLATAMTGADLLIHEVYSHHDDAGVAHRFGHSTARDAGTIARVASSGRLLLTHFRASKHADPAALAEEAAGAYGRAVEVARDLEVVEF